LINIARASNIDEEALLDELEKKRPGSAAHDVFEGEPNLTPRFLTLDKVLLQPRVASATVETCKAMGVLVFDNLSGNFQSLPLLIPVS